MPSVEFSPVRAVAIDVSAVDHDCTADFPQKMARRIYVGVGGDVAVKHAQDSVAVTYKNVPTGSYLDGGFATVLHTGTTATNMVVQE